MTTAQDERILALAKELTTAIRLYTMAHSQNAETLNEILMALHLVHVCLQKDR